MSARVCGVAKIGQSRRTLNKLESATVQVGSGIDGRHISQRVGIQGRQTKLSPQDKIMLSSAFMTCENHCTSSFVFFLRTFPPTQKYI